jgi:hypothetical protein
MFDFIKKQKNYKPKSCHYETPTWQPASINTRLIIVPISNVIAIVREESCKLRKKKVQTFVTPYLKMSLNSFFSSLTLLTAFIVLLFSSVTFAEEEKKKRN